MMIALDVMPWLLPAILTILVGVGVLLRRHHRAAAARIVLGTALALLAAWVVLSLFMALGAIA
ncbi:hypothetical protein [Roseomonas sp. CECT 9278]|uniref:hypothetical protein n=1 Tax=Roseomonas sp. CECT 9278 TaxID=2845823 RepID=UPI001E2FFDE0|nr:hypothetical protein [Roseomonas sp. CECT 9278]CAH0270063.1 hypothetical protein ROS9278_03639 [Roseomonas sp. CECT 9278]